MKVATFSLCFFLLSFLLGSFSARSSLEFSAKGHEFEIPIIYIASITLDKSRNSREIAKTPLDLSDPDLVDLRWNPSRRIYPKSSRSDKKTRFSDVFYSPRAPPVS